MSDSSIEPDTPKSLTGEAEAMLSREFDEFRKTLSEYAKFVAKHPEIIQSLRENLAFSAKYVVSNRAEFVEDYRDAGQRLDRFLEEFETGKLDPNDFVLEEDKRRDQTNHDEG